MSRTTLQSPARTRPPLLNRATLLEVAAVLWQENVMFRVIAWLAPRENGADRPVAKSLMRVRQVERFGPVRNVLQSLDGNRRREMGQRVPGRATILSDLLHDVLGASVRGEMV
jgi:hypothetical protein